MAQIKKMAWCKQIWGILRKPQVYTCLVFSVVLVLVSSSKMINELNAKSFCLHGDISNQVKLFRDSGISFVHALRRFPWTPYISSVDSKDLPEVQRLSTLLLEKLVNFAVRNPAYSINDSCVAPVFEIGTNTPHCKKLDVPRKVGMLWQFGFDYDLLEIQFNELNTLVDKFFILESIKPHSFLVSSKPLLFDVFKHDGRFAKFINKTVHFIIDDANLSEVDPTKIFQTEELQEKLRWEKFLEWNNMVRYFKGSDLIGFGDVDELPNGENISYLKNCQHFIDSIDIGIWFPFDGINTVFKTDFPVPGHEYTLGDPTFWTLESALAFVKITGKYPTRMRGKSSKFLLGGMHMSKYAYPPFQMLKLLTASEASWGYLKTLISVGLLFAQNKSEQAERKLNYLPRGFLRRTENLTRFRYNNKAEAGSIVRLPWFLKCNGKRYPGFYRKYDERLNNYKNKK